MSEQMETVEENNTEADKLETDFETNNDGVLVEKVKEPVVEEKKEEEKVEKGSDIETRYKNLEKLLGRQAQELGQLRKQLSEKQEIKKEVIPEDKSKILDKIVSNPEQAIREILEKREKEREEKQAQESRVLENNANSVYSTINNFDDLIDDIIAIAKEDNIQDADRTMVINTIRHEPAIAIMYGRRALDRKKYANVSKKTEETVDKIVKAGKTAAINRASTPSTETKISQKDLNKMTDADLKEMLKKFGYEG